MGNMQHTLWAEWGASKL